MSNYVKTTNFTSKDSLASGNPLKIVKGAEFDVEFNAIATAVASKADSDGTTLTNTTLSSPTITSPTITGGSVSSLATDIAIVDGGTGASSASGARTNLGAAASGANSDITSLSGLTTALSIAQGGTGNTTAANAFSALKQAASDTATGVVELATTAETQTGTDTTRAVTPAGYGASTLGINQTWQDVKASRSSGTSYTNSTGRPIMVAVCGTASSGSPNVTVVVGGVTIISYSFPYNDIPFSFIVPNGTSYTVTFASGTLIDTWAELR